jgi:hypothetical protein
MLPDLGRAVARAAMPLRIALVATFLSHAAGAPTLPAEEVWTEAGIRQPLREYQHSPWYLHSSSIPSQLMRHNSGRRQGHVQKLALEGATGPRQRRQSDDDALRELESSISEAEAREIISEDDKQGGR